MATRRAHKDVEYAVVDFSGHERIFNVFDEAAGFAFSVAAARGKSNLDVLIWSEAGPSGTEVTPLWSITTRTPKPASSNGSRSRSTQ